MSELMLKDEIREVIQLQGERIGFKLLMKDEGGRICGNLQNLEWFFGFQGFFVDFNFEVVFILAFRVMRMAMACLWIMIVRVS